MLPEMVVFGLQSDSDNFAVSLPNREYRPAANWANEITCSAADLTRRGQPRGSEIPGGFLSLAILPPGLLKAIITACTGRHYC